MIYFLHAQGTNHFKVGHTNDESAIRRRSGCQTGNGYKLKVVATMKGSRRIEKKIHWLLEDFACDGGEEWFEDNEILRDLIQKADPTGSA